MVSGNKAFERKSAAESITAVLQDDPPELSGTGRQIPPDFDRVIAHCVEKKPEDRFQSARDLAFALRTISTTTGTMQAVAPASRRRAARTFLWPSLTALLLVVVALIWLWTTRSTAIS